MHRPCEPAATPRRAVLAALAACIAVPATRPLAAIAAEPTTLRMGGTGMGLGAMRQIGDAYAAARLVSAVEVLPSLGTGGGLSAAAAGVIDVALAARPLKDAEKAQSLEGLAYAQTPIAFVTSPGVVVNTITLAEVAAILTGRLQTWPSGQRIKLVQRDPSDADWQMLRALSPDMAAAVDTALQRVGLLTVLTDQENAGALERLEGAFGAMSIGQMIAERRQVNPLQLEGVPPTIEALAAGQYRLSRTLYAVWRNPQRPEVASFLAYLRSETGRSLLTKLGCIPLLSPHA